MRRGIQILAAPMISDIFTVSYTPLISASFSLPYSQAILNVVDLRGDEKVRVVPNNFILFEEEFGQEDLGSADLYLMVIIRRNSANIYVSPLLDEFKLAIASRQDDKFLSSYV